MAQRRLHRGDQQRLNYLRPTSGGTFAALSVDVLHVRDDRIAAINCFLDTRLAVAFGQPPTLD